MNTLRNEVIRCYSIDIETDSTIAIDVQEQKEAWTEYTEAIGGFLVNATQILPIAPELGPYMKETLSSVSRAYRCGSALEETLNSSFDALTKRMIKPPPPPPPDPAVQVQQLKSADFQKKLEVDRMRVEGTLRTKDTQIQSKAEMDAAKILNQTKEFVAKQKLELEKIRKDIVIKKAELDTDLRKAHIQSRTAVRTTEDSVRQQKEAALLDHMAKVQKKEESGAEDAK